jgi:hypothetical protein
MNSIAPFAFQLTQGRSTCPTGPAPDPSDRARLAGRLVIALVSFATGVSEAAIMAPNRGPGEIARARQMAMYLLHTSLSASYGEVARAFCRDRTTVSHACRLIEDMRDDPRQDALLSRLESVLAPAAPVFALGQEA